MNCSYDSRVIRGYKLVLNNGKLTQLPRVFIRPAAEIPRTKLYHGRREHALSRSPTVQLYHVNDKCVPYYSTGTCSSYGIHSTIVHVWLCGYGYNFMFGLYVAWYVAPTTLATERNRIKYSGPKTQKVARKLAEVSWRVQFLRGLLFYCA